MIEIACVLLGSVISIVTTIGFECYQERKRKKILRKCFVS